MRQIPGCVLVGIVVGVPGVFVGVGEKVVVGVKVLLGVKVLVGEEVDPKGVVVEVAGKNVGVLVKGAGVVVGV